MKHYCPHCNTELIERHQTHVCPRHDIGDCTYNALELLEQQNEGVKTLIAHHPDTLASRPTDRVF
ncbi:hypothetical protein J4N45_23755 [Vibrio sp. SCSIO 43140]|uniref:hypothetical protein n=1 Tax=Vibrio TaxID=662 RepID=UPI0020754861|nr:hypothetical protein [Vibrio sp. SCSIO 43140]USD62388.1 hypothetical protein J4N45_23755 [Vibrio sp. SCSIO 43140]